MKEKKDNPTMKILNVFSMKLRNRVNRKLKKAKKAYYANFFEENLNNIKTSAVTLSELRLKTLGRGVRVCAGI